MKKNIAMAAIPSALVAGALALSAKSPQPPLPGEIPTGEDVVLIEPTSTVNPNLLNPVVGAPEYVYTVTPNNLLNLDREDSNYGIWTSMDSLNDLYTLAEMVRIRTALEQLNQTLAADHDKR